ncbi:Zinc finger Y-chromosomal protein [Portunus trituberculatus]|uniref:Zinc finger Y-chromosomal protein n=1 Tax=Portunus trituberculatus TaxID=210409 RepID=A0A5B7CQP2_PORTR|nr:Zinc finger Y-chromosomal protein [Portunus trituberculatus]
MDEDAHLCLRCRVTIVGLDNYVAHRQAGCVRNTTHEGKLDTDASVDEEEVNTYAKQDLQEVKESKKLSDAPYPSDTHSLAHGTNGPTTPDGSGTVMGHQQEIVRTAKYSSPDTSVRDCYVDQPGQTSEHQRPVAANTSSIHESYTVMEDFTTALPQPPPEPSMARAHVELKHKTQDSLSLSHRTGSSQAPFTGYEDPLLLHGHDPPNILRHFDSFSDHNKIPHEAESESHSEAMTLFKVSSSSYELESQNFESRYSDFYSLQPTPQEPLLTNVPTLDQSKTKERIQENIKPSNSSQSIKCKEPIPEETYEKGVQEAREEFPASSLKFSDLGTSDNASEKSELRQDDFLSSLELRSSVKVPTKRRHEEDDEYDEDEDDETRPPRHHTGGKWRPGSRPPPSVGGKWRPATPKTELEEDEEEDMEEDYMEEEEESLMPPPPTYTKGKWLPGKKMTNIIKVGSTVEYHCQPCSRVLKGKEAYERHLKSQLHFLNENKAAGKRKAKTSKEISPPSRTTRPARSKKMEAKNFLRSCIANLKSRKIVSHDATIAKHVTRPVTWKGVTGSFPSSKSTPPVTEEEQQQDDEEEVVHKISSGTPKMLCPICKLSFGEAYAALHFASLAHIHNELEERQSKNKEIDPNFNKLILQNIPSIVKTSPFFCESCKFYCNLHEDFLAHMNTHTNDPEDDEVKTMFTCSACSGEDEMQLPTLIHHLQTPHHMDNARDLVLQAQQVKLTSRTQVVCPMDGGTFNYRRQYQMHRRIKHQEPGFQVTNKRLLRCSQCDFKTLRKQQIRAHIKKTHEISQGSKDSYHCFICGLSFTTQRKAELHRRSAEHRTTLWRQRGCSVTRTCSLCYEEVDDLPALRRHMSQVHQKDCTPCHLCGAIPPLRSDLAKHQRVCTGSPGDMEGQHKCDLCSFKNDLLAHVLAHKTVAHSERQADGRYACHICKVSQKVSL